MVDPFTHTITVLGLCAVLAGLVVFIVVVIKWLRGSDQRAWDKAKIPLTVAILDDFVDHPELITAIENALTWWNATAGFRLFCPLIVYSSDESVIHGRDKFDILLLLKKENVTKLEDVLIFGSKTIDTMMVLLDHRTDEVTVAHDLGHILGLPHDEVKGSIMYCQNLRSDPIITPRDQFILESLYT